MEAKLPLWIIVLLTVIAPILGLLGIAVGAYITERSQRSQRALRKLGDIFVDVNGRALMIKGMLACEPLQSRHPGLSTRAAVDLESEEWSGAAGLHGSGGWTRTNDLRLMKPPL